MIPNSKQEKSNLHVTGEMLFFCASFWLHPLRTKFPLHVLWAQFLLTSTIALPFLCTHLPFLFHQTQHRFLSSLFTTVSLPFRQVYCIVSPSLWQHNFPSFLAFTRSHPFWWVQHPFLSSVLNAPPPLGLIMSKKLFSFRCKIVLVFWVWIE